MDVTEYAAYVALTDATAGKILKALEGKSERDQKRLMAKWLRMIIRDTVGAVTQPNDN